MRPRERTDLSEKEGERTRTYRRLCIETIKKFALFTLELNAFPSCSYALFNLSELRAKIAQKCSSSKIGIIVQSYRVTGDAMNLYRWMMVYGIYE